MLFVWQQRERFLRPYDYNYFGKLYTDSQYVQGQKTRGGIGDDGLYAFAGYYYITGGDISQVSFESPPLAKYLIGVSILLFHNELVINLFYAVFLILLVYRLGFVLTGNHIIGAVASFLVSVDPLFTTQLRLSLLDLPMTIFFLAGFYFFICGAKNTKQKKSFFLSAFFFSLSFTTRFFPILPVLLSLMALSLYKRGIKYWVPFAFFVSALLPVVYLLTHAVYFRDHSLMDFFRYQLWILHWRLGEPFVPGNIFSTILTGYYRSWWEKGVWLYRDDWSILIPLVFILGFLGLWRWRHKFPHSVVLWVVIVFLIYLATATVGITKFLLPIYPLVAIPALEIFFTIITAGKILRGIGYRFLTKHSVKSFLSILFAG